MPVSAAGLAIMVKARRPTHAARVSAAGILWAFSLPATRRSDAASGTARRIWEKYHHRCSMNERPVMSGKKPMPRRMIPTIPKANPFLSRRAAR